MPIGIIINALSVAVGGVIGMLFGSKVPEKIKTELIQIFGVCSMGMGISSIVLMKYMPAVVFSVVIGSAIGLATGLGSWVNKGAAMMQKPATGKWMLMIRRAGMPTAMASSGQSKRLRSCRGRKPPRPAPVRRSPPCVRSLA